MGERGRSFASGSLEYASARMHARLARMPAGPDWSRLEHARDLEGVLEAARGSSLVAITAALDATSDAHRVDASARDAWDRLLAECARWLPPDWSPALAWCGAIPRLDAAASIARGERPAPWMARDAWLAALAPESAPSRDHPLAPLAAAWTGDDPASTAALWAREWRNRLPADARADEGVARWHDVVARHVREFAQAPLHEAPRLRARLRARALATFRRQGTEAAGALAWLALAALDLERVRGELVRRSAFHRGGLAP